MKNTNDIICVILEYRITGITLSGHQFSCLTEREFAVNSADMTPVSHDISNFFIVKFEDIADHLSFTGFNDALFMAFTDHHDNLFFCDILFDILGVDARKTNEKADRSIDEGNKRLTDSANQCYDTNG